MHSPPLFLEVSLQLNSQRQLKQDILGILASRIRSTVSEQRLHEPVAPRNLLMSQRPDPVSATLLQ
jgi:hypothetical protein